MIDDYDPETDELISALRVSARVFFEKGIAVHVLNKYKKEWYNGIIYEWSVDYIRINELKKGRMQLFYNNLKEIEPYISPQIKEAQDESS